MAEQEIPVKTFKVEYECDKCKTGFMRPSGNMLLTHPPKYPHECTNCKETMNFDTQYPYQILKPILE